MKTKNIILISTAVVIFAACRATKQSTATTTAPATPAQPVASTPASTVMVGPQPKSTNGVYPPGNEELVAIQTKYPD
ncbi:MAG TPA: hypothetical protein VNX01_14885, partial [Bacteroidia bacterium]|nr:hypothetical protein [Bacteroidia bacterium]